LREDGRPYYVGKGKIRSEYKYGRAYNVKGHKTHGIFVPDRERILILKEGLTHEEACKHERYLIFVFGRKEDGGILHNKTEGGEGSVGRVASEETKKKISQALKGHKLCVGRVLSEETKKKIAESRRGKLHTEEVKKLISSSQLGSKRTEETKKRIAESRRGKFWWTNGTEDTFSKECPGPEWRRGRSRHK
jgi:hypothetical protein